ncbi:unnamed protein product [Symbiodinium necroappetens]|uniref:Uncharacterized protein n=1 Tax=Symbiodinium necroappetens TaxID=1628268 RepID=A0A812WWH1_9DINO|nr:unnamed protein product [Symbiodinium necroappetens]
MDILQCAALDVTTSGGFGAFLTATMRGDRKGWLHWLGVHCSSFVMTSRGSTGRSMANPEGCSDIPAVESANKMAARVALLLLATSAFLGTWVVEQPKSSLLFQLSPLQFVCERMQVFKCQFWMWHYESRTPKPTVLWSSSRAIAKFWMGSLKRAQVRAEQEKRNPGKCGPPVKRWIDKEGRQRFKGTFDLRATGQYTAAFGKKIASELHALKQFTPRPSEHDELQNLDAMTIWSAWGWEDLWPMADMTEFVKYLYGSKALKIPAEWAPLLPREL